MIYKEKILETIVRDFFDTKIINDDDILIVALSGGMDSMCLIDAFYKLQSEIEYKLMAIHIHHGIRGIEADRDLQFVKKYCKSMNVKLITEKVDAPEYSKKNGLTIEESARVLRYNAFENNWKKLSLKNSKHNVYVLVAHHENDQAETVIHNMIRGTGLKGISGMRKQNGYILRPLLDIKKSEIEEYVDSYDIPYVDDTTNEDIKYTRNYIRKEIIEKLKNINSEAISHIAHLARQASEVNEYVESESQKAYEKCLISKDDKNISISIKSFNEQNRVLRVGIIRIILNELISTLKDITKININDVIDLSKKVKGGHLDLPYNLTVDKKQKELIFKVNEKNISMSRRKKK